MSRSKHYLSRKDTLLLRIKNPTFSHRLGQWADVVVRIIHRVSSVSKTVIWCFMYLYADKDGNRPRHVVRGRGTTYTNQVRCYRETVGDFIINTTHTAVQHPPSLSAIYTHWYDHLETHCFLFHGWLWEVTSSSLSCRFMRSLWPWSSRNSPSSAVCSQYVEGSDRQNRLK